jgi:hypothetical protein
MLLPLEIITLIFFYLSRETQTLFLLLNKDTRCYFASILPLIPSTSLGFLQCSDYDFLNNLIKNESFVNPDPKDVIQFGSNTSIKILFSTTYHNSLLSYKRDFRRILNNRQNVILEFTSCYSKEIITKLFYKESSFRSYIDLRLIKPMSRFIHGLYDDYDEFVKYEDFKYMCYIDHLKFEKVIDFIIKYKCSSLILPHIIKCLLKYSLTKGDVSILQWIIIKFPNHSLKINMIQSKWLIKSHYPFQIKSIFGSSISHHLALFHLPDYDYSPEQAFEIVSKFVRNHIRSVVDKFIIPNRIALIYYSKGLYDHARSITKMLLLSPNENFICYCNSLEIFNFFIDYNQITYHGLFLIKDYHYWSEFLDEFIIKLNEFEKIKKDSIFYFFIHSILTWNNDCLSNKELKEKYFHIFCITFNSEILTQPFNGQILIQQLIKCFTIDGPYSLQFYNLLTESLKLINYSL